MRGAWLAGILPMLAAFPLAAQQGTTDLSARSAKIQEHYSKEQYGEAAQEIQAFVKAAKGTPWEDSLYKYIYLAGRCAWKTKGADAGAAAAEAMWAQVASAKPRPEHQLAALEDLSQLYYNLGRMPDCLRIDSLAFAIADAHPGLPAGVRGRAAFLLALDYGDIGRYDQAERTYRKAYGIHARSGERSPMALSKVCNGLGTALWHLGRYSEAAEWYQQATDALGGGRSTQDMLQIASIQGNLGILWQDRDLERSKRHYQQALEACSEVVKDARDPAQRDAALLNRARTFVNLATVYFATNDHGRAEELLELSLKDRRAVLEPDDPQLVRVYERMASLEMAAGRYAAAEKHVLQFLHACGRAYGEGGMEYTSALGKLGEIAFRQGRMQEADSLLQRSIEASKRLPGWKTDPELALTYRRRSMLRNARNDHAGAMADMEAAMEIMAQVHGADHYTVAGCEAAMAEIADQAGDRIAAQQHAQRAMQLMQGRLQEASRTTLPRSWPASETMADAVYWSVRTAQDPTAPDAERAQWDRQLTMAMHALDRQRAAIGDPASQLLLIASQKRLFDLALGVAYDAYERAPSDERALHFLQVSEADRSILLRTRLNQIEGLRFGGVPDSILRREEQLIADRDKATGDGALVMDLSRNDADYTAFLEQLQRDHPAYFRLRYGEPVIDLEELRRAVTSEDQDLLIYAVGPQRMYMLVVRADTTVLVQADAEGLDAAVKTLNKTIKERDDPAYCVAAHALYNLAFAPVRPYLDHSRLLVITDGPLQTVNLETLLDAPCSPQDMRQHVLLRRYAIGHLLSASTALQQVKLDRSSGSSMLAMAPGFDEGLKMKYRASVKDTMLMDRDYLRMVRQPFAVQTAQQLGGSMGADIRTGASATEPEFRKLAGKHAILHLGTHAEMNALAPLYSKLVLSKVDSSHGTGEDGYLHAYEIYELQLDAELVVLNACETAAGTDDSGEGIRSLGYSFAYAGCPSLVASLWQIDERSSSEIISRFYEELAAGVPKHVALQRAKLHYLDHAPEELASPFFWAGHVLIGSVAPLDIAPWWQRKPWLAALAVMLVVASGFLWFRYRKARA
jgi:CHAT domain-containing protein/Tfp pilus assembly protein PilF